MLFPELNFDRNCVFLYNEIIYYLLYKSVTRVKVRKDKIVVQIQ